MDGQDNADRFVSAILAVALSGAATWWLLRISFEGGDEAVDAANETPLQIEFLTRPIAPRAQLPLATRDVQPKRARLAATAVFAGEATPSRSPRSQLAGTSAPHGGNAELTDAVSPSLDLHVHPDTVVIPRRTGPLDRARKLDPRTTRFEAAWAPQTDALQTAGWRHPMLNVALHAFGGPPRHCSEVERRLLKPDCLPQPEADPR